MKKLTCLFILVFCLSLQMMAQVKKTKTKPATPAMPDIEKMLKDLPADQRNAVKDLIKNTNIDEGKYMQPVDNVTGKSKQAVDAFKKLAISPDKKEVKRGESVNFTVSKLIYIQSADNFEKSRREREAEEDRVKTRDEHAAYLDKQMKEADKLNPSNPDYSKIDPNAQAPETTERHRLEKIAREVKEKHDVEMNDYEKEIDKKDKTESSTTEFEIIGWKMNGFIMPVSNRLGELKGGNHFATYRAPSVVPLKDVRSIQIDCELVYKKTKEKFTLRAEIRLLTNGWFKANIDGEPWFARELLDPKNIAAIQSKTDGEIKSSSAFYWEEPAEAKGLILQIVNGFPTNLALRITNPHLGANLIDCNSNNGSATLMKGNGISALTFVRNQKRENGGCDMIEEICKTLTVNITALNLKTGGLVEGNFSGLLFGGETNEKCINTPEHKVNGSFSLTVVMQSSAKEFLEKNHIKAPTDNN